MKFQSVDPDGNYFLKFASESGKYEVGFYRVMYGVRVRAGLAGDGCCIIDYCAGADYIFALELLATVIQFLEKFPENVSARSIEEIRPTSQVKPINLDPCWDKLKELAK